MAVYRPEALYGKTMRWRSSTTLASNDTTIQRLKKPTVLWGDSLGLPFQERDVEIDAIQRALPDAKVTIAAELRAHELQELLATNQFDIVVLTGNVSSDGSVHLGTSGDVIAADGLAKLIGRANTKLVILACCNSVPMAAKLAPVTNMIAATENLRVDLFQAWNSLFFQLLGQGVSVSEAYNIAATNTQVPLAMLLKRDFQVV
jgi:hypothetical protein